MIGYLARPQVETIIEIMLMKIIWQNSTECTGNYSFPDFISPGYFGYSPGTGYFFKSNKSATLVIFVFIYFFADFPSNNKNRNCIVYFKYNTSTDNENMDRSCHGTGITIFLHGKQ